MSLLLIILRIIASLTIYNVWFIRSHRTTVYRGGNARTLKQEFTAYGLPVWMMYLVGTIKVAAATGLLLSIWYPVLMTYSAFILLLMMFGAISMHLKINDSFKQTMPALIMFIINLLILVI
jgi:hypothetical protein